MKVIDPPKKKLPQGANPYEAQADSAAVNPYEDAPPAERIPNLSEKGYTEVPPDLEQNMQANEEKMVGSVIGMEGVGGLGKGLWQTAKKFPVAAAGVGGLIRGGVPGAMRAILAKGVTGAMSKMAAPAERMAPAVDYDRLMSKAFNTAGADAGRVASGNDAMAQGISNLTPQAPNPMSMEEAFNSAGAAGAPASAGNAAMAKGIANIQPGKMPLDKAMGVLSKGMPGAGKFGGGAGAAVGMALQGPQSPLQGGMAPVPPPLSTNLPEAKQAGLQALEAGQPHSALAQMLGLKYDAATVKFVLAGLPNRVPQ